MKKPLIIGLLVVVAALFVVLGVWLRGAGPGGGARQIAVIPKGTTHDFWKAVHEGAEQAAAETEGRYEVTWTGPEREGDRERQIQIVEDFIVRRAAGVVLAPSDARALIPVVERAGAAKIPVVIIDSGIETEARVAFVATDNEQGGAIAAKRMGALLGGRGKVAVLKYMAGSASTTARERGFMETLAKSFPQIELVEDRYGMDTVETALSAAEDLLTRHAELDGLFACNESTTRGALRALESQGRAGQVKLIGFDSSEPLIEGLRQKRIDSLVVQNPFQMGYLGVKAVVDHLEGRPVEPRVDTGVELVTLENLETPAVQKLLR